MIQINQIILMAECKARYPQPTSNVWKSDSESLLIHLVRKNRCLWDPTIPSYSVKLAKRKAYEEISLKLKELLHPSLPVIQHINSANVMRKFSNLRTYFQKEFKRVIKSGCNPNGSSYSSQWEHFNKLMFLAPFIPAIKMQHANEAERLVGISDSCRMNMVGQSSISTCNIPDPLETQSVTSQHFVEINDILNVSSNLLPENIKSISPTSSFVDENITTFAPDLVTMKDVLSYTSDNIVFQNENIIFNQNSDLKFEPNYIGDNVNPNLPNSNNTDIASAGCNTRESHDTIQQTTTSNVRDSVTRSMCPCDKPSNNSCNIRTRSKTCKVSTPTVYKYSSDSLSESDVELFLQSKPAKRKKNRLAESELPENAMRLAIQTLHEVRHEISDRSFWFGRYIESEVRAMPENLQTEFITEAIKLMQNFKKKV